MKYKAHIRLIVLVISPPTQTLSRSSRLIGLVGPKQSRLRARQARPDVVSVVQYLRFLVGPTVPAQAHKIGFGLTI